MLTVCASSTDQDLTTTGALKSILGIVGTSRDVYLSTLIRQASQWAQSYVGYPLTLQSYTETVAGYGRFQLMMKRTPIRAIDRVFNGTDTGSDGAAAEIFSSQYTLEDSDAGLITRPEGFDWSPIMEGRSFDAAVPLTLTPMSGQEQHSFLVDYRAGWVYGGLTTDSRNWSTGKGSTDTGRTLPDDIELAVLFKAQAYFEGGDEPTSQTLGDISVNFSSLGHDPDGRLLTRSGAILETYRRFA